MLGNVMLPRRLPCALLLATLTLTACKDRQITAYRAPKDPAPAVQPSAQQGLPADHPPIGAGDAAPAPGGDMATMANTAVPTAGGSDLRWTAPASWTPKAGSSMRKGSFTVKRDGAEADFAITAFPGDTGGLHANLNRWRGQVGLPNAAPADLDASVQHLDGLGGMHFDVVDLVGPSGTRMLGAITSNNGNSWFFKLMGPDTLVAGEKQAFIEFLHTVKTP
jgi:hypothetical protein